MSNNKKSKVGFLVGLISAIIILILPDIESLPEEGKKAAAVFVWMAVWWATEAVPIAITALIPLVFFP